MSLALNPLKTYGVLDPVIMQQSSTYSVVSGCRAASYQVNASNNISDGSTGGSVHFDVNPAHENVYVDRRLYIRLPIRLKITVAGATETKFIIASDKFAIRSFPAQKAMDTIVLNINGLPSSVEIGKIMSALELFNIKDRLKKIDFSKCSTYAVNQSQNFQDTTGTVRSALGSRDQGVAGGLNKGALFTTITNPAVDSGGDAVAIVDILTTEPLYLSPMYFGPIQEDSSAFLGINSMSIGLNFSSGGGNRMIAINGHDLYTSETAAKAASVDVKMWFHNHGDALVAATAFSYVDSNQPAILVKQMAPSEVDTNLKIQIKNYPYTQTRVWVSNAGSIAQGASTSVVSQNMQLSSVPSRVYAYIREKDSNLRKNPFHSDTFYRIKGASVLWGVDTRLSGASQEQLYDMAIINGCELDWNAWSGLAINKVGSGATYGTAAQQYKGCGSILSFSPMDLGLPLRQAPGKSEHFNLQITLNYENLTGEAAAQSPDLFVVVVSQGIYSIYDGQASALLGILSENDVLNTNKQAFSDMLNYGQVRDLYAGNMMGDLKSEMQAVIEQAKPQANNSVSRKTLRERLA